MFDANFWLGLGVGIIIGAGGLIFWAALDTGKQGEE